MKRKKLLKYLAAFILEKQKNTPILVGIDGVDACGKTTLAKELCSELKKSGRKIISASIDGFHNPKSVRYNKGEDSPQGYYLDSFNHKAVVDVLLNPLSSGNLEYKTAVFNYLTDSEVLLPFKTANKNSILIMEGIFLFRPELVNYWDIKIFVDVEFKTTVKRATERGVEKIHIGTKQKILAKYEKRYIPGQRLYFDQVQPKEKADIVIDNNDFENPEINHRVAETTGYS